ncbi:hypothetical protein D1614_06340 [Maribellus luteus]|uniref:Tetratricopeptide repeat protein n=1 Tax=Maribellus luteus TaxID=2305463 RepID=A0A399T2W5_9BACT|nr:hypothetical protein [Maribellus luteus]RIJ49175.1 hypothetical protein D1614_06340 [Maribellus luteus]
MNRIPVRFIINISLFPFFFPYDIVSGQDTPALYVEERLGKTGVDDRPKLKIHYEYGEHGDETENYPQAIIQFKNALRIAQYLDDNKLIAQTVNYLVNMFAVTGDFKNSNETYILKLKNAEKNGDTGEIAKKSMNLAPNNYFTGNYDKAILFGLFTLKTKETNTLQTITSIDTNL